MKTGVCFAGRFCCGDRLFSCSGREVAVKARVFCASRLLSVQTGVSGACRLFVVQAGISCAGRDMLCRQGFAVQCVVGQPVQPG